MITSKPYFKSFPVLIQISLVTQIEFLIDFRMFNIISRIFHLDFKHSKLYNLKSQLENLILLFRFHFLFLLKILYKKFAQGCIINLPLFI